MDLLFYSACSSGESLQLHYYLLYQTPHWDYSSSMVCLSYLCWYIYSRTSSIRFGMFACLFRWDMRMMYLLYHVSDVVQCCRWYSAAGGAVLQVVLYSGWCDAFMQHESQWWKVMLYCVCESIQLINKHLQHASVELTLSVWTRIQCLDSLQAVACQKVMLSYYVKAPWAHVLRNVYLSCNAKTVYLYVYAF